MQEGWKCPRCGKVWAPWVDSCPCYLGPGITIINPFEPYYPKPITTGDPLPPPSDTYCEGGGI